jgi:hypothetical protein
MYMETHTVIIIYFIKNAKLNIKYRTCTVYTVYMEKLFEIPVSHTNTCQSNLPNYPKLLYTVHYIKTNKKLLNAEVGNQVVLKVRKSQIHKFLGSFRYHKSANSLGVPVCKLQIRKFL